MAVATASVVESVIKYIQELRRNDIPISEAIIFGSYVRGTSKEESDIDVALISDFFTGDRFEDRRKIIPFRRMIDNRIEPMPFRPEDFQKGGILVEEIKRTGKVINIEK
jgi:uncharacterized protein